MDLADWDYDLPPDRIADRPTPERAASRLLVVPRGDGALAHHHFADLPSLLAPGDLLVANDTRVMAARLHARRATGGRVELLVLEPSPGPVRALARPARKLAPGGVLRLEGGGDVTVRERLPDGEVTLAFDRPVEEVMATQGAMPLPPYLSRPPDAADRERYQTVYAGPLGAAAAPTAGLHFTPEVLDALRARAIGFATVTLHVGIGTFRPLREEDLAAGRLHAEWCAVPEGTSRAIAATRAAGGRVIAVGTTTARTLESATPEGASAPEPGERVTDLLITPPYRFRAIDGLITNFHLPRSSLLMLVAALIDRERLLRTYRDAVAHGYRFTSYGDAMLVV